MQFSILVFSCSVFGVILVSAHPLTTPFTHPEMNRTSSHSTNKSTPHTDSSTSLFQKIFTITICAKQLNLTATTKFNGTHMRQQDGKWTKLPPCSLSVSPHSNATLASAHNVTTPHNTITPPNSTNTTAAPQPSDDVASDNAATGSGEDISMSEIAGKSGERNPESQQVDIFKLRDHKSVAQLLEDDGGDDESDVIEDNELNLWAPALFFALVSAAIVGVCVWRRRRERKESEKKVIVP
ncbi:unnamed protein product [Periconia digitata]|uniref:Uncharacterized protein n=1 Tax=Periconia digitata TaxID=1303443 RepID=A0A9W4U0T7_9PLEO|nr:unnamed protein product [Periconia digitata]